MAWPYYAKPRPTRPDALDPPPIPPWYPAHPTTHRHPISQPTRPRPPPPRELLLCRCRGASTAPRSPVPHRRRRSPTPPSAAEAAGSRFSMLTVNDMDTSPPPDSGLPTINVDDQDHGTAVPNPAAQLDSAIDMEPIVDEPTSLTVRKPRQRSGAVSSGHGGSPRPVRGDLMGMGSKPSRGFSMGWRADCEKCRLRVPGHMNHFVAS